MPPKRGRPPRARVHGPLLCDEEVAPPEQVAKVELPRRPGAAEDALRLQGEGDTRMRQCAPGTDASSKCSGEDGEHGGDRQRGRASAGTGKPGEPCGQITIEVPSAPSHASGGRARRALPGPCAPSCMQGQRETAQNSSESLTPARHPPTARATVRPVLGRPGRTGSAQGVAHGCAVALCPVRGRRPPSPVRGVACHLAAHRRPTSLLNEERRQCGVGRRGARTLSHAQRKVARPGNGPIALSGGATDRPPPRPSAQHR